MNLLNVCKRLGECFDFDLDSIFPLSSIQNDILLLVLFSSHNFKWFLTSAIENVRKYEFVHHEFLSTVDRNNEIQYENRRESCPNSSFKTQILWKRNLSSRILKGHVFLCLLHVVLDGL